VWGEGEARGLGNLWPANSRRCEWGPRPAPFGEVVVWWGDVDVGGWAMRAGAWCFRVSGAASDEWSNIYCCCSSQQQDIVPFLLPSLFFFASLGIFFHVIHRVKSL
jgi:hypothetical protein